jgi:hypothetical protein
MLNRRLLVLCWLLAWPLVNWGLVAALSAGLAAVPLDDASLQVIRGQAGDCYGTFPGPITCDTDTPFQNCTAQPCDNTGACPIQTIDSVACTVAEYCGKILIGQGSTLCDDNPNDVDCYCIRVWSCSGCAPLVQNGPLYCKNNGWEWDQTSDYEPQEFVYGQVCGTAPATAEQAPETPGAARGTRAR